MAKLPTIKLAHRRSARVRIVNLAEYSFDLGRWADWKIVSVRHGDAPDEVARDALREWKINTQRLRSPAEQARRKDHARAYQEREIEVSTRTLPRSGPSAPAAADWRGMRWFAARAYVKRVTGTAPRNKAHAERLMQGRR